MDKLAPSMRSLETLEGEEGRLLTTMESFEKLRNEQKAARKAFEDIKEKRRMRFSQAFKHISSRIDNIYFS
jgi:structural maintenance of chromosome 1